MNARQCPDDLLVKARRRGLSDLERQVLTGHLGRCELCRAGELAANLLRARSAAPGGPAADADLALVERVAERTSAAFAKESRPPRWGWRRVAVAVVAFLALGGVASAWIGRSFVSSRAADRAPVQRASSVRPRPDRNESVLAPPPAAQPSRPLAPARKHLGIRLARADVARPAPRETAASLFARATGARHEGDLRGAVALYERLRLAFPDSDQARISSISMGDLLIHLQAPARALQAFDSYLSEVETGPLREEALFGRARCLEKLGEEAAEQETWARLVRDFPSSAYASAARQRLDELRRAR